MHCADIHVRRGMRRHHLVRRELRQPKEVMMMEEARRERERREKERRKNRQCHVVYKNYDKNMQCGVNTSMHTCSL